MFSLKIVGSDAFLEMPVSARELYFQLGMYADDDGFVNPRKIMRMIGSSDDDLKMLIAKRFALPFENGVVVIKHWLINNLIRKDFYQETQYLELKNTLFIKPNKAYTDNPDSTGLLPAGTHSEQIVNNLAPQVRLGKVSKGKDKIVGKADHVCENDIKMAEFLRDLIRENMPTFKEPNIGMWSKSVNKIARIDKRTYEQIEYVIRWAQKNDFWQANILSPDKLRKQFDTLVAQIKRGASRGGLTVVG